MILNLIIKLYDREGGNPPWSSRDPGSNRGRVGIFTLCILEAACAGVRSSFMNEYLLKL